MSSRPTPFDLVFGPFVPERFEAIRAGFAESGRDPRDREAFVLVREVVELLREIGPEDTLGAAVRELVALLHAGYLYWLDGGCLVTIDRETLAARLQAEESDPTEPAGRTYYLQLPARRVWAEAVPGAPPEPIDGAFVIPVAARLEVVAILGLQIGRDTFTVVEAGGHRPAKLIRFDGTPLFAPQLAGGAQAGLLQVIGGEELIELVHRCHALLPPGGAAPGTQGVRWL